MTPIAHSENLMIQIKDNTAQVNEWDEDIKMKVSAEVDQRHLPSGRPAQSLRHSCRQHHLHPTQIQVHLDSSSLIPLRHHFQQRKTMHSIRALTKTFSILDRQER